MASRHTAPLPILEYPDPRLRQVAAAVEHYDNELGTFIDALFATLYATSGIGLCAPQVGRMQRILVADLSDERAVPELYINPEILSTSTPGICEESCLSVPDISGNVMRSTRISVRARDADGVSFERDLHGMHAVCVQHEVDHLNGKLFIDRLWLPGRLRIRGALRALERKNSVATA